MYTGYENYTDEELVRLLGDELLIREVISRWEDMRRETAILSAECARLLHLVETYECPECGAAA